MNNFLACKLEIFRANRTEKKKQKKKKKKKKKNKKKKIALALEISKLDVNPGT